MREPRHPSMDCTLGLPEQPITLREQIQGVRRELAMRRSCYPRWVAQKKMPQTQADYEIRVMEAVLATLEGGGE